MSTLKQRHDIYEAALGQIFFARTFHIAKPCQWCSGEYAFHTVICPVGIAGKALEMGLWSGLSIEQEKRKEANS